MVSRGLGGCIGKLIFIMKKWNSLFHYFYDLFYALQFLICLSFILLLFYFSFISSIICNFVANIFAFIFGSAPCFFLLERNFKICKIEAAKISLTLRLLKSRSDITKLFFLSKEAYISMYFFSMKIFFLFPTQPLDKDYETSKTDPF